MFPGPTLLSAASAIVEIALNRALELDTAGRQALLDALTGPAQFNISAPVPLTWTLECVGERVQVRSQPADAPELVITGRPMAFVALAWAMTRCLRTIGWACRAIPPWPTNCNVP